MYNKISRKLDFNDLCIHCDDKFGLKPQYVTEINIELQLSLWIKMRVQLTADTPLRTFIIYNDIV